MSRAVTCFKLEASVRVKPMMMELPYAQQSGIEVLDTDTWNTLHTRQLEDIKSKGNQEDKRKVLKGVAVTMMAGMLITACLPSW